MRTDVAKDMQEGTVAFKNIVWPLIANVMGGGTIVTVEDVNAGALRRALDVYAGIDVLQVSPSYQVRGIGCRVQWIPEGRLPWDTFSIRHGRPSGATTECEKRLAAIEDWQEHWLFPAMTVQAYLRKHTDEFLDCGAVRTHELFMFIKERGVDSFDLRPNKDGSSDFIFVEWATLTANGVPVEVVHPASAPDIACEGGNVWDDYQAMADDAM